MHLWLKHFSLKHFSLKHFSLKHGFYTLLPGTCLLCGTRSYRQLDLCSLCESDLPWMYESYRNICKRCGLPLPETQSIIGPPVCGQCLCNPPPFQTTISLFRYSTPIDYLIHQLKYKHNLVAGKVMGLLLAMSIKLHYHNQTDLPEVIIPVPLHKKRLRERGYNQATELANIISNCLSIPLNPELCHRVKNTPAQQSLKRIERRANIKDAFALTHSFKSSFNSRKARIKHIALVDDVVTTGATAIELGNLFLRAGVQNIDLYTLARTTYDPHS